MGGHNNTVAIIVALSAVLARRGLDAHRLNPWYFPSAEAYRKKLEQAQFTIEEIAIVPRPTTLPTGIEPWLDTFAEDFFLPLPEADRSQARAEVTDLLRPVLIDETGTWIADYVRLRFRAIRAESRREADFSGSVRSLTRSETRNEIFCACSGAEAASRQSSQALARLLPGH